MNRNNIFVLYLDYEENFCEHVVVNGWKNIVHLVEQRQMHNLCGKLWYFYFCVVSKDMRKLLVFKCSRSLCSAMLLFLQIQVPLLIQALFKIKSTKLFWGLV